MSTVTNQEAAEQLGVGVSSVMGYLAQKKLTGDAKAGTIDVASIEKRTRDLLRARVGNMDEIKAVLEIDESTEDVLTSQERSVLTARSKGDIFEDIADTHKISWQGAQLIVVRAIERVLCSNLKDS